MGLCLGLLLAACGCVQERVVWSPDGQRAAVLADKGLYLSDPEGKLSGMLLENVVAAEWFPDSERLVAGRAIQARHWRDLRGRLSREQRARITALGKRLHTSLLSGLPLGRASAMLKESETLAGEELEAALLWLRDEKLGFQEHLPGSGIEFDPELKAEIFELIAARVESGEIGGVRTLASGFRVPWDIRVSPDGKHIAYTMVWEHDEPAETWIVPADGSAAAVLVEKQTTAFIDWSQEGRSLVYLKTIALLDGGLGVAALEERHVLDSKGEIRITPGQVIAQAAVHLFSKVRTLKNGNVMFSSYELQIPAALRAREYRERLFTVPIDGYPEVSPVAVKEGSPELPEITAFFEPSPDGRWVSIPGDEGEIVLVNLESGESTLIEPKGGEFATVPTWRGESELCFAGSTGEEERLEIFLWKDGRKKPISGSWPEAVQTGLLD